MLSSLSVLKMGKPPDIELPQNIQEQGEQKHVVLPMSFSNLSSLTELNARAWKFSSQFSDDFEKLSSLQILNLEYNNFCNLPTSLSGLSTLKRLLLSQCKELKSLPPLPSSLIELDVANCISLGSVSEMSKLEVLRDLNFSNCKTITDIPGLEYLRSLRRLYMIGCDECFPAIKRRLTKVALKHLQNLAVPASEIPSWFSQEIRSLSKPRNCDIKGVIIGVVISLDPHNQCTMRNKLPAVVDIQAKIVRLNEPIFTTTLHLKGVPNTDADQLHLCRYMEFKSLVHLLEEGDDIIITTRDKPHFEGLKLKKFGIHLIFENSDDIDCDEGFLDKSQWSVSEKLARFFSSL